MTSCHDVINTDYFTPLLSPEVDVIEGRFFFISKFFCQGSQWNVNQIRSLDAWPCTSRSRDPTSDLSSLALYMLETWFCLFAWFAESRKSTKCKPDAWLRRVTLYVKVMWPCKWRISSWALYMLETWIVSCYHGLFNSIRKPWRAVLELIHV